MSHKCRPLPIGSYKSLKRDENTRSRPIRQGKIVGGKFVKSEPCDHDGFPIRKPKKRVYHKGKLYWVSGNIV